MAVGDFSQGIKVFAGSALVTAVCLAWLRILWGYICELRQAARMRSIFAEMECEFDAEVCELYNEYEDGKLSLDELGDREEFLRALYMKMANDLEERFRAGSKKGRVQIQ